MAIIGLGLLVQYFGQLSLSCRICFPVQDLVHPVSCELVRLQLQDALKHVICVHINETGAGGNNAELYIDKGSNHQKENTRWPCMLWIHIIKVCTTLLPSVSRQLLRLQN